MHPYMTHHDYKISLFPEKSPLRDKSSLRRTLGRWVKAATQSYQNKRMVAALDALDDRILRDIGLTRGEIHGVVYGYDDLELGMTPTPGAASGPLDQAALR